MNIKSFQIATNTKKINFSYRANSIGDKGVIKQIFVNGDYNISQWEQGKRLIDYYQKFSINFTPLIIDAGANIGASSVFFAANYENSLVFSIEPNDANFNLLSLNTKSLNCINFLGAISNLDGELMMVDPGRSDWGFMTKNIDSSTTDNLIKINSICPRTILNRPDVSHTKPLIFKIDIEGGEESLFSGNSDWLQEFPLIIIELHDWMLPFSGSSKNFLTAIAQYNFDILHKGENMFLFNRDILL